MRQTDSKLTRLYRKSNGGALGAINVHFGERRNDDNVDAIQQQVPARNRSGFDRLIHSASAYCLHIGASMLSHYAGNRSCHSR